jgi:hypothetical protein
MISHFHLRLKEEKNDFIIYRYPSVFPITGTPTRAVSIPSLAEDYCNPSEVRRALFSLEAKARHRGKRFHRGIQKFGAASFIDFSRAALTIPPN